MPRQISFISNNQITTGRVVPQTKNTPISKTVQGENSFKDVLNNELLKGEELKFSAHVLKRLDERSISLSDENISDLKQAVTKAKDKGIRESLVVMDDVSFIVNIKNRTVITAVDKSNMKENIITNIDGAVFI